jgi:hypothetical protein
MLDQILFLLIIFYFFSVLMLENGHSPCYCILLQQFRDDIKDGNYFIYYISNMYLGTLSPCKWIKSALSLLHKDPC